MCVQRCFRGFSEPIARTKAWKTKVTDIFRDVEPVSPEQRAHGWPGHGFFFLGWGRVGMWQERCQELYGALIIVDLGCPKEFDCFPNNQRKRKRGNLKIHKSS